MMRPEMTPNWTQFGVYFGVLSSVRVLLKGQILYIWVCTGLAQIRVQMISGTQNGTFWVLKMTRQINTSDPGPWIPR